MSQSHDLTTLILEGTVVVVDKLADPTRYYKDFSISQARREVQRMMESKIALVTSRVQYIHHLGAVLELIKLITANQKPPSEQTRAFQEFYEKKLQRVLADPDQNFFPVTPIQRTAATFKIGLPREIIYSEKFQEDLEEEFRLMDDFAQHLEIPEDKINEGKELAAWFSFAATRVIQQTSFSYLNYIIFNTYETESNILGINFWRENIEQCLKHTEYDTSSIQEAFKQAGIKVKNNIKLGQKDCTDSSKDQENNKAFDPKIYRKKTSEESALHIKGISVEQEEKTAEALNSINAFLNKLNQALTSLSKEISKEFQFGYDDVYTGLFAEKIEEKIQQDEIQSEYLLKELRKFFFEKAQKPKILFFKPADGKHSKQDTKHQLISHYKNLEARYQRLKFLLEFSSLNNLLNIYKEDKKKTLERLSVRYLKFITNNEKAIFEEIQAYLNPMQQAHYYTTAPAVKPTIILLTLLNNHPSRPICQELVRDFSEQLKTLGNIFETKIEKEADEDTPQGIKNVPEGPAVF